MIYAQLNVFSGYCAYITAKDHDDFVDCFCSIVEDCLWQFCYTFGKIHPDRKIAIASDLDALRNSAPQDLNELFYDLRMDGAGYRGTVEVDEIYRTRQEAIDKFQDVVDELNLELTEDEDERWAVFGGGFFPEEPGFDIDILFK